MTVRGRDRGRGHRRPGGSARTPAAQGRRWARMNQMNDPASRAKSARTAALGLGSSVTWVFPLIAIGVFIAILALSRKLASRTWAIGLGLLLGGLFGNLVDRLFRAPSFLHGAVVDFIDLSLFICNVADIAI